MVALRGRIKKGPTSVPRNLKVFTLSTVVSQCKEACAALLATWVNDHLLGLVCVTGELIILTPVPQVPAPVFAEKKATGNT